MSVEIEQDEAQQLADIHAVLRKAGYTVLNRDFLNQILACCDDDVKTRTVMKAAQDTGGSWFGSTMWQGRLAFRISLPSWTPEIRMPSSRLS